MKKKVFSLMMTLLLAFVGVAKADVVTIGDPMSTTTNSYLPGYTLYDYSISQQIYTADEIGMAGTINTLTMWLKNSSSYARNLNVYMKEVSESEFASATSWVSMTASDMVGSFTMPNGVSTPVETAITLSTPFAYSGNGNLVICFQDVTGQWSSGLGGVEMAANGNQAIYAYRDGTVYDVSAPGVTGTLVAKKNVVALDITGGGGGSQVVDVTIGDPTSTTTNSYLPGYTLYDYAISQQIYTADEIGVGGTINTLTMWLKNSSSYARNINVYMKEVSESEFASATSWVSMTSSDMVGSFTMPNGVSTPVETAISLSTPFAYSGNGNLVICFQDVTGQWSSGLGGVEMAANGNQAIYAYRDGTVFDVSAPGVTGTLVAKKNVVRLSITTAGGGGQGPENVLFALQYDEEEEEWVEVDTIEVGPRPNGAWMEPFTFQLRNDGPATTVSLIDFTPQNYFSVAEPEMPLAMAHNAVEPIALNTDNAGQEGELYWQMVAIYGEGRTARVWDIMAEAYNPGVPDVVETAYDLGTVNAGFSYQGIPSQITPTELHQNYDLPFDDVAEDGLDAVYKFTVADDVMITAYVDSLAENGKVALYTEDFNGEGGPMATNNYTGLEGAAGGAAAAPFEVQIGEGTTTTSYVPFYCFYNYSLSQQLFTAAELQEAGVTSAPMTSLSWQCSATNGNQQNNITIWMANVDETAMTATTMMTNNMDKVFEGSITPAVGWNEFVFNQGNFSWDGHSNILVTVQRNNGAWASGISWYYTGQNFTCSVYKYTDSTGAGYGPFDMTANTYSGTTSTYRANIIMKGGNREGGNRDVVEIGDGTGTTYYFPIDNYFNYSCTEQIYTADEIGTAGTINSISFYYNYGTAYTANNVTMYMKNVTRDSFASTTDCEPLAAEDIVWTGSIAPTAAGWYTFTLDTPFQYDGTSNLLVAFYDGTSGYPGTSYTWRQTTSPNSANMALRYYSDSSNPNPYDLGNYGGSKTLYTYRSNVQIDITPGGSDGHAYAAGPVIKDLPLSAGTYYLVASATQADYDVFINVDPMPCPIIADAEGNTLLAPNPADDADSITPRSVTLRWMVPDYATGWRLVFGSTYYPDPQHPQTVMYPEDGSWATDMANSYTVRNLWNNTNYFWHVEFNNDDCPNGVSSPVWGFTTTLNVPEDLTAVDYTVFNDETITLNWTAVEDRTYRQYFIYRDGVKIGETDIHDINHTTYTDGPLAYNMDGYEYYVTAVYDEGESYRSNIVNVKVSGYTNNTGINGYVYEQDSITGIAGATVTIVGNDEFGVSHTYTATTNNNGYYSKRVYAGTYSDAVATRDGYQTVQTIHPLPFTVAYNGQEDNVNFIMDENFDPVCQVIAQYYPDSLDPESPYVKVYWGCGLPGSEIIEDFETGDFSMFDWNVNGAYPWEVTTTHPYEGTYCMRSTNYNVSSSTSSIDVTVDIPADGIMSFFGYISSESNWDYGYFYIDGVQKGSYTGAGNSWGEKRFDITEGTHNFKWEYTKDGSVNSNEDRFYVDYITFYKQPEPAQPGWHTYCESEFNNAVGSNLTTTPSWAYEYPASFLHNTYAGWNITKVSLFSDNMYSAVGGNYTCRIYVGGTQPAAGTLVSTLTVDVPQNLNAWVDWDLTTPVNVTGNDPIWVVWTANSALSSWPAGCCGDLNDLGTWWDGGNGWEHLTYGTWTMRHWFTNRAGRSIAVDAADIAYNAIADANPLGSKLRTYAKGEESNDVVCANPNAEKGASIDMSNTRHFSHYRVYRTDCYNDGPYTLLDEEHGYFGNTRVLACEVLDTVYIDTYWNDPTFTPAGVYKWGVGVVYVGNRGEEIAGPIHWAQPANVTRDVTAEATDQAPVQVSVNRAPWDLMHSFEGTSAGQQGVATDGNYIYTASWQATPTGGYTFYKYDLNGTFIEGFDIAGATGIRDLSYDGQYFYGSSGGANIFKLDLANQTLVGTITCSGATSRHCTYDPVRNGLWVGNWSTLALYDMNGTLQFTAPAPTSAYGSAYFVDDSGDEHLYLFCQPSSDAKVFDYNITTNTLGTSAIFDFATTPGYNAGISGGCFIGQYNGKLAFFGNVQQSPNLIGIYELKDASAPVPPTPGADGDLQEPRESEIVWSNCLDKDMYLTDVDVTVLLNSADSPEGTTVTLTNLNEGEQELYPVDPVTLDGTGFYAWDSFRRGYYSVKVEKEGYETITVDTVDIWNGAHLRYVMIEIIYGVSDLYVSSTGWAMWGAMGTPGGGQGGGGGQGQASTFSVNFDDSQLPAGWTTIDANNDGYNWVLGSQIGGVYLVSGASLAGSGHNSSADLICSGSYSNYTGQAITPDNYLVSPQVNLVNGSTFSFWACAQDSGYPAEHFGVFVSSTGTGDWTEVQSWTLTAKGSGDVMSIGRGGELRAQGNWYQKTVDLSAYAGQKYIAIRHFNCNDQFILDIDDIELTNGAKAEANERHLEGFKVMCTNLDGEPIFNTNVPAEQPFCQVNTDGLVEGNHYIAKVAAIYSTGMSGWTECEWQYIPCENYAGTVNGVTIEGNEISWEYPGGGGGGQGGNGDTFTESWDNGLNGWTNIDNDGDGHMWYPSSEAGNHGTMAVDSHSGAGHVMGESYCNATWAALTPDDYLVSPQQYAIANGSTISMWACTQDVNYPSEHFGFAISTGSNTSAADFTTVAEWTITAKGAGNGIIGRDGRNSREGNWYQFTADLSSYAGQNVWIAVRHFACTDMFILNIDDIELTTGAKGNRAEWTFANGFVTDPGAMSNGGDASWIKGSQSTFGPGCQVANSNRVGDSFTLDAATTIDEITVYGYQTGSSTTSTFNGLYVQIYNGNPMNGATAVWGDANANIMTSTAFTGAYRGSDGDATGTTRPIMSITASGLNIELEAGTYYLVYQLNGTGSSGPWAQPHAEPGIGNTGNGVQYLGSSSAWQNLTDSGAGTGYGIAMSLHGNQGGSVGPTPTGDVLGAMIFADGEWEAFVEYPTNTYTYEGEAEVVCVRMVYNGTNNLPEGNIYFSMSCPECEPYMPGQIVCEPGDDIHSELVDANHIKVWWGDAPAAPISEWLYYFDDNATQIAPIGAGGSDVYWGIMFPANSLQDYAGTSLTKMAMYQIADYNSAAVTVNIFLGGSNAPQTLVSTMTYTPSVFDDFQEVTLTTPVPVDGTQNLWITVKQYGEYPALGVATTGNANARWISLDGASWEDVASYDLNYDWLIQGFVTNQAKGGEVTPIEFTPGVAPANFTLNQGEVVAANLKPMNRNRAELVEYRVYRATEAAGDYVLIGTVTEETAPNYYEYIDSPTVAGTYYYRVTAYYDNDCESEPAMAADGSGNNYVSETTTAEGVDENGGMAIFPNPTKANVTIQAKGMQHITVVSVLGQVVYDADVDTDEIILNMAQYAAGMYTVRVMTENGVHVERVSVVR